MEKKETILSKIQKLLALATSDNPHEAALALSKAQALLHTHNVSMAEVQVQADQRSDLYALFSTDVGGQDLWRKELLHAIAQTTFCDLVYRRGQSVVGLVGEKENVEGVRAMYVYVVKQLEQMAVHGLRIYRINGGTVHTRAWKVSFFTGAVSIIWERLLKEKQAFDVLNEQTRALIVVKDTDLRAALARLVPHLKIVRGRKRVLRSPDGYEQGQQAGRRVRLEASQQKSLAQIREESDVGDE
jgi:uncharacterized protein DUF2786